LALVGGIGSLMGSGVVSCAAYGPVVEYGPVHPECSVDSDCVTKHGAGWVCENESTCVLQSPDAGNLDAGK